MVRVCIGLCLFACLLAILDDAGACGRRRSRRMCSSSYVVVCDTQSTSGADTTADAGRTDDAGTTTKSTSSSAQEAKWWEFLKEYDYPKDVWDSQSSADRKQTYDKIKRSVDEATEKVEKELKEKEKLENKDNKKKNGLESDEGKQTKAAPGHAPAPATMVITLPADARLVVGGTSTTSTSDRRVLVSPPLTPGQDYYYTIVAQIVREGRTMVETEHVAVRGGETTYVTFGFASEQVASR